MSDTSPNPAPEGAPAPRKRGGFTIFLYVVLVLAIVLSIWAMGIKKKVENNPTVAAAVQAYEQLIAPMKDMTQAQIEQQAEPIAAVDLAEGPDTVKGRYVVVDGEVQGDESAMVNQNMSAANMVVESMEGDTRGYVLDEGVVLVDISGEQSSATYKGGDYLRGYGAVLVVNIDDVFDLPFVGPDLKKDFGDVKDTAERVVFVFSKGVKTITPDEATPPRAMGAPVPGGAPSATGDGTTPPADGAAPPADGAAPPEGTPPGDGTTPPGEGENPPATPPGDGEPPPATPPGDGETPPATPPATPPPGGSGG